MKMYTVERMITYVNIQKVVCDDVEDVDKLITQVDDLSIGDLQFWNLDDQEITKVEDISDFGEMLEKAENYVRECEQVYWIDIPAVHIDVEEDHDVWTRLVCVDELLWDDTFEEIMLSCNDGAYEKNLSEVSEADQYNLVRAVCSYIRQREQQ